ncbi:MAG TPA: hypothetical protein VGO50_10335 [Pyrinomonadaceae bacterium]|jgi:hypothetical protein|nr:hypothetical protein [Pyrinomonadaceae bacterium]
MLLFAGAISAQTVDKTVEKIRAVYDEIAEKARAAEEEDDQGEFGELVMNELAINKRGHQWRAVGNYVLTYKFFYRGGDSEEHLYPDELVKVRQNISSRSYYQEFLYDKSGALIFYFQKAENDEQVPAERRVYFSIGRAIRLIEADRKRDRLTVKDAATIKEIMQDNIKIKDIFVKSIKL